MLDRTTGNFLKMDDASSKNKDNNGTSMDKDNEEGEAKDKPTDGETSIVETTSEAGIESNVDSKFKRFKMKVDLQASNRKLILN